MYQNINTEKDLHVLITFNKNYHSIQIKEKTIGIPNSPPRQEDARTLSPYE